MRPQPVLRDKTNPLVTITVHNYNYGRYLHECLESVVQQTYPNIEVCFSDNASTDDSWDIALEFAGRYPGLFTLTRNRMNFGAEANVRNCAVNIRGTYFIELCSDDALDPLYVETGIQALSRHPEAAFAMVHRCILDAGSRRREEAPFYDGSYRIPGQEQAAVYMMASVNPSISQIMYDTDKAFKSMTSLSGLKGLASNWYSQRLLDFSLCCEHDILYLDRPLLRHRLHGRNDAESVARNLIEVLGPYVLQHQFAELARPYGHDQVVERLPRSLTRLGRLSLRYSLKALHLQEEELAERYFHLAQAIEPEIRDDPAFPQLGRYFMAKPAEREALLEELDAIDNFAERSVSYPPPPGSVPLDLAPLDRGPREIPSGRC
jgi:glycosyltransferase involved in cell wall biosynthesis